MCSPSPLPLVDAADDDTDNEADHRSAAADATIGGGVVGPPSAWSLRGHDGYVPRRLAVSTERLSEFAGRNYLVDQETLPFSTSKPSLVQILNEGARAAASGRARPAGDSRSAAECRVALQATGLVDQKLRDCRIVTG